MTVAEIAMSGERRRSTRLYEPFPTQVRGASSTGKFFTLETVIDNISSGGLYLKVPFEMDPGKEVSTVVCFRALGAEVDKAPRLWIKAKVVRSEPQPDGRYGVALAVQKYRFL